MSVRGIHSKKGASLKIKPSSTRNHASLPSGKTNAGELVPLVVKAVNVLVQRCRFQPLDDLAVDHDEPTKSSSMVQAVIVIFRAHFPNSHELTEDGQLNSIGPEAIGHIGREDKSPTGRLHQSYHTFCQPIRLGLVARTVGLHNTLLSQHLGKDVGLKLSALD
eukprot:6491595-Amphidinium_carterae.1